MPTGMLPVLAAIALIASGRAGSLGAWGRAERQLGCVTGTAILSRITHLDHNLTENI